MGCSKSNSKREVYGNTVFPQEQSQINNITLHQKQPEKEEQTKPKIRRRKEIINIRAEINEIEMRKQQKRNKSWFFEKINKIDKPLARLIKDKKEWAQINKIRSEKGEVITNTMEIQRIIRDYKQLYANKMDNLEEMDIFLQRYSLSRPNQEEI